MSVIYYKTKESVQEYIQLAKDVNGAELIEQLKHHLPLNSNLLEIGSGPGSDWEILSNSFNVTGSDNSDEFLKRLNDKFPEGEFKNLDAITLHTDLTFAGIYSNKVLHHLKDDELKASIKRQNDILEDEGVICHSFWKGEGSEVFKGMFVNYHNEEGLRDLFSANFKIISLSEYKEFDEGDSLLLIAKKK